MMDYLASMRDSAVNVPGSPKVGPKTAVKWLAEHGSLQEIVKHADEIKGKVGESLRSNLELLYLSKELVTLKLDVDLKFKPHELVQTEPDKEALREAYSHWQFRSWLSELDQTENNNNDQTPAPRKPKIVKSKHEKPVDAPVTAQEKKMENKTTDKRK